jgi:hypothetical protein
MNHSQLLPPYPTVLKMSLRWQESVSYHVDLVTWWLTHHYTCRLYLLVSLTFFSYYFTFSYYFILYIYILSPRMTLSVVSTHPTESEYYYTYLIPFTYLPSYSYIYLLTIGSYYLTIQLFLRTQLRLYLLTHNRLRVSLTYTFTLLLFYLLPNLVDSTYYRFLLLHINPSCYRHTRLRLILLTILDILLWLTFNNPWGLVIFCGFSLIFVVNHLSFIFSVFFNGENHHSTLLYH